MIDYEVRRELVRAGKTAGITKLNSIKAIFRYVPITTGAMNLAADLWAQARNAGVATGDPKKLDIDVILAAQALSHGIPVSDVLIVTANVSHISRFARADEWETSSPDVANSPAHTSKKALILSVILT